MRQVQLAEDPDATWTRIDLEAGEIVCRARVDHSGGFSAGYATDRSIVLIEMEDGDLPRVVRYDLPETACPE